MMKNKGLWVAGVAAIGVVAVMEAGLWAMDGGCDPERTGTAMAISLISLGLIGIAGLMCTERE